MPQLIVDVVNQHRAALLAQEQAAMQEMARRWLQVEQALDNAIQLTALELINNGTMTPSQIMRSRRWFSLMEQTRDELRRYEAYIEPRIISGQRNAITQAVQHSEAAVQAAASEAQIVVPFNRLPVTAVENMVGLADDGSPLRAILQDASRAGADAMGEQLVRGIALGVNPREVARRAMRLGLGTSYTRMVALARTEQLRVYRLASLDSYRNSRVVVAYKRLSARDRRTCIACLFADGQQYPVEHGFDEHVQGRCTMIPVLANVPAVQFQDGKAWFRTQPEAVQRAMLGPGRFELWQRGEASLDDMVSRDWSDTWGASLRVTNVARLRGGGGRMWAGGGGGPVAPVAPSLRDVAGLNVDDLADLGEMERWGAARYSNIRFDFAGAHVDTIRPTLKQFDKLAQKYPEVAKRLDYVGTYRGNGAPDFSFGDNAFAHATQDGKQIGLNPKWYGNPSNVRESVKKCFDTGWIDANGQIEDLMTHEFGHQVEHWLLETDKAFSKYMTFDGTGIVGDTVRLFNKANKPTKALSQYATTTNSMKTTSYQQWVDNRVEAWTEGFAAIQTKPRAQWTDYVERLNAVIEEVGDTKKWTDVYSNVFVTTNLRDADPAEYERAQSIIKSIRERLNL